MSGVQQSPCWELLKKGFLVTAEHRGWTPFGPDSDKPRVRETFEMTGPL